MERLFKILDLISPICGDKEKSFNILINYICAEVNITGALSTYTNDTKPLLVEAYNIISNSKEDLLGNLYEKIYNKKLTNISTDLIRNVKIKYKIKENEVNSIFIKDVESGKLCIELSKMYKNSIFYCTEEDRILYLLALINISINNIPAKILYTGNLDNIKVYKPKHFRTCNYWVK